MCAFHVLALNPEALEAVRKKRDVCQTHIVSNATFEALLRSMPTSYVLGSLKSMTKEIKDVADNGPCFVFHIGKNTTYYASSPI